MKHIVIGAAVGLGAVYLLMRKKTTADTSAGSLNGHLQPEVWQASNVNGAGALPVVIPSYGDRVTGTGQVVAYGMNNLTPQGDPINGF